MIKELGFSSALKFLSKLAMDHTCKLHAKCLKEDESLEKCEVVACNNVIQPSCCKN